MNHPDASMNAERRTRHDLRAIFPAACQAIRPFFEPDGQWSGQSHALWALRTLKEEFPSMDAQDAYVVVLTVKRMIATGAKMPPPEAS